MSHRNDVIDVLKGLGIILVVYGHLIRPSYMFSYIFSFHMPLFFFVSGYCYTEKLADRDLLTYSVNRFMKLIIPSWIYVNLYFILKIGWKDYFTNIKSSIIYYIVPENEWFLPTIFVASILLWGVVKARTKMTGGGYKALLSISAFIAFAWCGIEAPLKGLDWYSNMHPFVFFRVDHAFVALSFMILGFIVRNDLSSYISKIEIARSNIFVCCLLGIIFLYFIRDTGYINLCDRAYGNSVCMFYVNACYWIGVWAWISFIFTKYFGRMARWLVFLGRNSLWIYILQGLFIAGEPYILGIGYNSIAEVWHIWTWEEIDMHYPSVPAILYCLFIIGMSAFLLKGWGIAKGKMKGVIK